MQESLEKAYEKCFGQALMDYNATQKRKDRRKENYLKEIENSGNKEKTFYENIVQIGKKEDTPVVDENGNLTEEAKSAIEILEQYAKTFQERNPNLYLFNCVMHLDEATPHLHIDFVPFTTDSKRGLDTRVSMKGALKQQGFSGTGRSDTELNQWRDSEKEVLSKIMLTHGIEWEQKGTHEKHKSVSEFKRDKLIEEVENGCQFTFCYRAIVVSNIVKQVHDITMLLLLIASHYQTEFILCPRHCHVQHIGIVSELCDLIIHQTHDNGIVLTPLILVDCSCNSCTQLTIECFHLIIIWGNNTYTVKVF